MISLANVESKSHCTRKKAGGSMRIESDNTTEETEETGTIGKEEHRLTTENISVDSVVLKQEPPYDLEMSQNSKKELDKIILPPGIEDWQAWNKVVFEQGDLQILLKLGAWMLVRFHQLAKIPMDREDDFYEALGMEHLYSTVAHIDTHSRFLRHLFHKLGRSLASSDDADTQSEVWPIGSPPAVNLSMISDMGIPWLLLMDMMAMHALQNMVIGEIEGELDGQCDQIGQIEGKQKRTLSHLSLPMKEGGCERSKCPKETITMPALSTTTIPIETTTTFKSTPKIPNIAIDDNPDATGEDDAGASLVDGKHIEIAVEADHGDFLVDSEHIVVTGKENQADQPTNATAPAEHSNIATLRPVAELSSTVTENANDWLTNMIHSSG
ncbi:hypothetical protein C8R48DRAFT_774787 [Suillus tomentosus]|nr:hypothetical protein C8R48DRAFT_774787 [Suillus tomentosus]